MSELSVGQLKGLTVNNNIITVPAGHTLYDSGHIVQVVSTFKSDAASTSSTSFVDLPGMSVTITPISSSSRFFVMVDGVTGYSTVNNSTLVNLVRNSTNIAQGTGQSSNQTRIAYPNSSIVWWPISFNFLDSPASASPVTYKLQFRSDGAGVAYWGRRGSAADYSGSSSITVFEVAG
jgi:hypothetical protein